MMDKRGTSAQYRKRLDKALLSPDLTNGDNIKALVHKQLLFSSNPQLQGHSHSVVEKRTMEVSNFLDMLRSVPLNENETPKVHVTSHPEWKLKQNTEQFRVMYREGVQGSPFHTLLAEGYVDGAVDECLCVSWESGLYPKWWPQIMIPTFKLTSSQVVKKVHDSEQISLLRVKVPWPLSDREALLHYFEFEYAQEDLVVVLLNTISDVESINVDTHGFSKDDLSEAKDVRIDVVGGYAIQKVTPTRSYFRTIMSLDIKLDFVPPSLINFIARQLIGTGFKLYEKTVISAFKNDDDFRKALTHPLYVRINKALSSEPSGVMEQDELISETFSLSDKKSDGSVNHKKEDHEIESSKKNALPTVGKTFNEIVEEEDSEDDVPVETVTSKDQALGKSYGNGCTKFPVSSKVGEALGTLDKVIYLIQKQGYIAESRVTPVFTNIRSSNLANGEFCAGMSQKERNLQESRPNLQRIAPNVADKRMVEKMQGNGNERDKKAGQRSKNMLRCFR